MSIKFINEKFDEERALYGINEALIDSCSFSGPLDGESPLKECSNIDVQNCYFELRYPLWHNANIIISKCELTNLCRAALWYCKNVSIDNSFLHGIKALRECEYVQIYNSDIDSQEFGWFCHNITIKECKINSEYAFLKSSNLEISNIKFKGKYSFQYVKNAIFENCEFDTKDAFWHGENIIVKNSVVKGEYLAWYAKNITFINCKIIGTQPLCYCGDLKLVDCEMIDCDLSFEKSNVEASILNEIESIKNPLSGVIVVKGVKNIIIDDENALAKIIINK